MSSIREETVEIEPGEMIIEQGSEGSGFFVLQSGTLEVYKDDVLLAVLMYPGTIFGEMGDILGKPRSCTVRAKNNAKITHVQAGSVSDIVYNSPDTAVKIVKTLATRLERTTQKLADTTRENPLWSVRK